MDKIEFNHSLVRQGDGIYYLLRNEKPLVCKEQKLPYNITDQNGKTTGTHSWCCSNCPFFELYQKEEIIVSIKCSDFKIEHNITDFRDYKLQTVPDDKK